MFAYKEQCSEACKAITAISDVLHVTFDDDVKVNQPALVHLPIINDVDDPESDICLIRRTMEGDIELGTNWSAMKCESTGNCYTFQINKFDGYVIFISNVFMKIYNLYKKICMYFIVFYNPVIANTRKNLNIIF